MKIRHCIALTAVLMMFAPLASAEESKPVRGSMGVGERSDLIERLRSDINLWNLMNGLHLSRHQVLHMIRIVEERCAAQDRLLGEFEVDKMEKAFRALADAVEKDEEIPEDIQRAATHWDERGKELRKRGMSILNGIESEAEDALTPAQVSVIHTYKPCLVPPKNLRDPVRVGQADSNARGVEMMDRLRRIPEEQWQNLKYRIAQNHLDRVQKAVGDMSAEEKKQETERLVRIVEEARAMDDVEYELNKAELAERAVPERKQKEEDAEDYLREMRADKYGAAGKISQFLLDPRILPLLKKRLERLDAFRSPEQVELDKVEAADNCKDGHCAIDEW